MNWEIIPQLMKTKDGEIEVNVKPIRFRPASKKELEYNDNPFRRMQPTLTMLFKHKSNNGSFKITAQHRKGDWRFNLHEPARIRVEGTFVNPKERLIKESTGTHSMSIFFKYTLPQRLRDQKFCELIEQEFRSMM